MIVEVGIEKVLRLHEFGQIPGGQLAAERLIYYAVGEGSVQLFIHIPRVFQPGVISGETLDMLAFHRLGMDGGVAGILDGGIHGNDVFERRHIGFGGAGTVGMGFRALSVLVEDADGMSQAS